jgi:hypothetical protein
VEEITQTPVVEISPTPVAEELAPKPVIETAPTPVAEEAAAIPVIEPAPAEAVETVVEAVQVQEAHPRKAPMEAQQETVVEPIAEQAKRGEETHDEEAQAENTENQEA